MCYNARMIQITAYLRNEEDLKKWKALSNKVEFIHNALNPPFTEELMVELTKDLDWEGPIPKKK